MPLTGFLCFWLRRHANAVGDSINEVEKRHNHYRIENIFVGKASGPQPIDIFRGDLVRGAIERAGKIQQPAIFVVEVRQRPVIPLQGSNQGVVVGRDTEKLSVGDQSISAAVPGGYSDGKHLLPAATE